MTWLFWKKPAPKLTDRQRHVAAMIQAIELASREAGLFKGTSRTNGLRAIRYFETVNGVAFDPTNEAHLSVIDGSAGMGAPMIGIQGILLKRKLAAWRESLPDDRAIAA